MNETDLTLRTAEPADEAFLETLFCQVHASDFAGASLPDQQVRGLIQMQARAQRLSYLRDFPAAESSIVTDGALPIGRLLVNHRQDAIHVIDIAVLPERQRQGIGTKLLRDVQAQARERAVPVQLSVFPQNPAIRLYSQLGFQITGGGMQIGMQWSPASETARPPEVEAPKSSTDSTDTAENAAAVYTRLTGRRFRPEGAPFEITLDHMQHHRTIGTASFSLFFRGPLEPYLPQGNHSLHLLDGEGQPERDFVIFLGPVGPEGSQMQYEAVFNL